MAIRRVPKIDRIKIEPDGDTTIVGASGADVRLGGRTIAAYQYGTSIDFPGSNVVFYVSGSKSPIIDEFGDPIPVEDRKPSDKVAVFGGDVVISGTLFGGSPLKVGGEGIQFPDGTTQTTAFVDLGGPGGQGLNSGSLIPLGYPQDTHLTSSVDGIVAYDEWDIGTKVTDAIDDLNETMFNVANGTNVHNMDFIGTPIKGRSPLSVVLGATGFIGSPNTWSWKISDGSTGFFSSTGPTTSLTIDKEDGGFFTVELTGSNSRGVGAGSFSKKRKVNYIKLFTPTPIPLFSLDKTSIDSNGTVVLTNNTKYATSYVIDWGDGSSDIIPDNTSPGGVGGGTISHQYPSVSKDTVYDVKLSATSLTADEFPVTIDSNVTHVYVYSIITPALVKHPAGINRLIEHRNPSIDGHNVVFANMTMPADGLGATIIFGPQNYWDWDWGDSNVNTKVDAGTLDPGSINRLDVGISPGQRSSITHLFQLDNDDLEQTFKVYLSASNGHTSSPFVSSDFISVKVLPTLVSSFTLDKTSIDTGGTITLTNTSKTAVSYTINWGDGNTTNVPNNTSPGGVGGGTISHTYNVVRDTKYTITLTANSPLAPDTAFPTSTSSQVITVWAVISPSIAATTPIVGTNKHRGVSPAGFDVTFSNTSGIGLGNRSDFTGNKYIWEWGDGTTDEAYFGEPGGGPPGGVSSDGSPQSITHRFSLTNVEIGQTFNVVLKAYNGHSTSPFSSTTIPVRVNPAPIASFTTQVNNQVAGVNAKTGYAIYDINNVWRGVFTFANTSKNATKHTWTWGDGAIDGPITTGPGTVGATGIQHKYNSVSTYTVSLWASGSYSTSNTDDTQTDTVTVLSPPTAPGRLDSKTISIVEASQGSNPYLASGATNNSGGSMPSQGTPITRFSSTTPITTTIVTNVSSSHLGNTLSAIVNNSNDGSKAFTNSTGETGTFTSLVVTAEGDANSQIGPTYPIDFYQVFSARVSKSLTSLPVGYNTYKLSHSFTGDTNTVGFIKDDVTAVPSLDLTTALITEGSAGTYRYISGIPYYNAGSPTISVAGTQIYDWIGQTYRQTTQPFEFAPASNDEGTSLSVINTAYKTYLELDGSSTYLNSGIPIANTGKNSSSKYTIGSQTITLNLGGIGVGTIKARVSNVNGVGAYAEYTGTKIQTFTSSPTFNELNISVASGFGGDTTYTDPGVRVTGFANTLNLDTPVYNSATNFYTSNQFTGAILVAGTVEAVVRWNILKHFTTNLSSGYLPIGPDLNTSRSGKQYFTFAFRRKKLQNFKLNITTGNTGLAGVWVAVPGTAIDNTSTLNGWLDTSIVAAGGGIPGANTGAGGNGSNGCALDNTNRIIANTDYSAGKIASLTFRTVSTSTSTNSIVLVRIALNSGQTVSSISVTQ